MYTILISKCHVLNQFEHEKPGCRWSVLVGAVLTILLVVLTVCGAVYLGFALSKDKYKVSNFKHFIMK